MIFSKKKCRLLLIFTMLLALLTLSVGAETAASTDDTTAEQIIQRIEDTYDAALRSAGRYRFANHCSEMVNHSMYVLGLESRALHCDGSQEYDLYAEAEETSNGYRVVRYSAREYDLAGAMYAVCDNGKKDVYNIIVGWQSGTGAASGSYGHTCFIHAILDGTVYFSESYGLYIADGYYYEGEPIVCSIEEFASYYNKWAYFEGLIHFEAPDTTAPKLSAVVVSEESEYGFTLKFRARDNLAITDIYAKVWTYGQSEEDALVIPAQLKDGFAHVRVDTEMFDGFVGRYYLTCYASDKKGNISSAELVEGECVNLYFSKAAEGTYEVSTSIAGVHDSPASVVQGTGTLKYIMQQGTIFEIVGTWVNDNGEIWYQLSDGEWINSAYVERRIQWDEVQDYLKQFLTQIVGIFAEN